MRAAGEGEPFLPVTLPPGVTLLGHVVQQGELTHTLASGAAGLLLLTSSDGGLTFSVAREQAIAGAPVDVVFVDGAFYVSCRPTLGNTEVWRVGVTAADATARALTDALEPTQRLRLDGKLVASTTTVAWLQRFAPGQVRLVRWGADGALLEIAVLSVPDGDVNFETVFAEGPTLWGAGRTATARTVLRRDEGGTSFVAIADFDISSDFRAPFARVGAGVLANLELRRTRNDCFQTAVVTSSDDGVTWSAPALVRPRGGCLQLPWQMAALNDDELAITLSDSHALRAWDLADGVVQSGQLGRFPAHDTLFMRAPLP